MMKRKTIAILTTLMMVMTILISKVNAQSASTKTIVINNTKKGHTYSAYAIFKGDLSDDGKVLTNIEWGNGVEAEGLLTALKEMTDSKFKTCTTAEGVAKVIEKEYKDSDELDKVANVIAKHLSNTKKDSTFDESSKYTISDIVPGYYFIKDSIKDGNTESNAVSKYIVRVGDNVSIDPKVSNPTIEIKTNQNTLKDGIAFHNTPLRKDIPCTLTTEVPDMDGYTNYTFNIKQEFAEGFSFDETNAKDIIVKLGNTVLVENKDYKIENVSNSGFEIKFIDFIEKKEDAGKKIDISFNTQLNDKAKVGVDSNIATTKLEYSSDPYSENKTTIAPNKRLYVYTTNFDLIKVDSETGNVLSGAEFELQILDGTVYKKVEKLTIPDGSETGKISATDGVGAGKYKIVEIKAPNKYSLLKSQIPFEIKVKYPEDITKSDKCEWKIEGADGELNAEYTILESGRIEIKVKNVAGVILPLTGGIGRVIFISTGVVILSLGVFIIVKNIKSKNVIR